MKFGLLYEIQPWDLARTPEAFWEALEQVKVAEAAGFSHVFVVEHHFLGQFSMSSSPEVWLSAVAQHTSTIRIGHGSRLLPFKYNNPIRVAEMAAVLDIMSNGRLDLGTARSASGIEMLGFDMDPNVTRAEWDEALHMIPRMWAEEEFSWDSPTFSMPPRNVLPKPIQQPHPPLWVSGTQPSSSRLAAERGIGYMHFSITSTEDLADQVADYKKLIREPSDPVSSVVNDQFAAFTTMFCGTDDADANARGWDGIEWYSNMLEHTYSGLAAMNLTDDSYRWYNERFAEAGARVREMDEMQANHSMLLGGPDTCRAGVQWFVDQGVDMLLLSVQNGSTAHADICDALVRFGNEVIPTFA